MPQTSGAQNEACAKIQAPPQDRMYSWVYHPSPQFMLSLPHIGLNCHHASHTLSYVYQKNTTKEVIFLSEQVRLLRPTGKSCIMEEIYGGDDHGDRVRMEV